MNEINFNESKYLEANPDVAMAVRMGKFKSGFEHYQIFGKKEGRKLKLFDPLTREEKVMSALNMNGLGLEIGPSHNPIAPKRGGYNVHILDHLSADELRKKYAAHDVCTENIEDVDFVWSGQPLTELIGQVSCYDWIIASHIIEHMPDLISFLQQCEALLKPVGRLSLVIPDKRFCFDYFNAPSSTGEFLDAFEEKRIRPSAGKVFDHFSNASKRGGRIAWSAGKKREQLELVHSFDQARSFWQHARGSEDYFDVHCWRFTPESFHLIMSDFNMLELTDMEEIKNHKTTGCEFYVTLGKNKDAETKHALDRLSLLQQIKSNDI